MGWCWGHDKWSAVEDRVNDVVLGMVLRLGVVLRSGMLKE